MKKLTIAALVATQMLSAVQPAAAADLVERDAPQMGAFAGARLRIPLGAARAERRARRPHVGAHDAQPDRSR